MSLRIHFSRWSHFAIGFSMVYTPGMETNTMPWAGDDGCPSDLTVTIRLGWLFIIITIEGTIPPAK